MKTRTYREACDASAAVRIGESDRFVAASDEDCVLRVYDRSQPGLPVARLDVTAFLEPDDPEETEADIEGAAQIGDRIYWIGSHGRNSKGKKRRIRQRLFATTARLAGSAVELRPAGAPYKRLLKDLASDESLASFDLDRASALAPEEEGGLNIEGLAPSRKGNLLIGLRNPVPDGRALVVELKNPKALIDGDASRARLGVGGRLDLGGRGIRALEFVPSLEVYLIVAGSFDDNRDFSLYRWSGKAADDAEPIATGELGGINPEEAVVFDVREGRVEVDLLSDDGGTPVGGGSCKQAPPAQRRFRAVTVSLPV